MTRPAWCLSVLVALGCRTDPVADLLPLPDARPYTVDRFPDARRAVVVVDGGASAVADGGAGSDAAAKGDGGEAEDDRGLVEVPPCLDPGCDARQEAIVGAITLRETRGSLGVDEASVPLFEFRDGHLDAPAAPIADDDGEGCLLYNAECIGCGASGPSLSPGEVVVFGGTGDPITFTLVDGGGADVDPPETSDFWVAGNEAVQVSASGDAFGSFALSMPAPEDFVFILTDESPFSRLDGLLTWTLAEGADPDAVVEITLHPRGSELRAVCSAPAGDAELQVSEAAFAWLAGEGDVITLTYVWRTRAEAEAVPEGRVLVTLEREAVVRDVTLVE